MEVEIVRQIPVKTQIEIFFTGQKNLIGTLLLIGGLLLSLVIVNSDAYKNILFMGGTEETRGKVTAVLDTGEAKGGKPLKRILYNYTVEEKNYSGEGYSNEVLYEVGERIKLEYPSLGKGHSRIVGINTSSWSLIFLIVPLAGLLSVLVNLKDNLKVLHLLKHGIVTKGVLVQKEKVGKAKDGEELYQLKFQFKDREGNLQHTSDFTTEPAIYRNGISEKILYSPKQPNKAMTVDNIPVEVYLYDI